MDMKSVISCVLGVGALFAGHATAAEATFLPGLYEFKVSYPDDGPEVEKSRECLTAAEVKQESLEQQLAKTVSDSNCRFTQRTIGGGRFAIAGTCNNDGVRSTLRQSGTYSSTAMSMNMTMSMVPAPGAKPVDVRMVMSSQRISATCPAGTDKE